MTVIKAADKGGIPVVWRTSLYRKEAFRQPWLFDNTCDNVDKETSFPPANPKLLIKLFMTLFPNKNYQLLLKISNFRKLCCYFKINIEKFRQS